MAFVQTKALVVILLQVSLIVLSSTTFTAVGQLNGIVSSALAPDNHNLPPTFPPVEPPKPHHHHHHHHHPHNHSKPTTTTPPPASPPTTSPPPPPPSSPPSPPHVKPAPTPAPAHPPTPPVKPPTPPSPAPVKPPTTPVKPPVKPPTPPATPPVKPPTPPAKPPVKPPSPAPQPLPSRKFVAARGVVYCKACKYKGVDTFLGASPLEGAIVKLACNNTKYHLQVEGKTDKNGFFFIQPKWLTTAGFHKCKVFLVKSPKPECNVLTNTHNGISGAILIPSPPPPKPEDLPGVKLFNVGPFAFEPSKNLPCQH